MIQLTLLAAGLSRRFGANKLLQNYRGAPLFRYSLDALSQVCRQRTDCCLTVVTRYNEIVRAALAADADVQINDKSELGISTSLHLGVNSGRHAEYLLFAVADQPGLNSALLNDFLDVFLRSGKALGCVSRNGVPGNPCIFHRRYAPELLAVTGDRGGKGVLLAHREDCLFWEGPELRDMDTPEDFRE